MKIMPIIIAILIVVFIIVAIKRKIKLPESRGDAGESKVAKILGETVPGEQYVINDLLFTDKSGHSCQIDHIYINKYGIWVIETKNYSGMIYGNENQRTWTQVLAYGNEKNTFYNPVKQNATHIYRLSEYLQVKDIFHNVVCFLTNADISHVKAENIYYSYNLPSIKKLATNTLLSVEKMEHYYTKLTQLQEDNATTKKEHIENIHDMQYKISRGICPRCGGMLVLRNGKNGQFYGCSYYPECKFTMNKKEGEK